MSTGSSRALADQAAEAIRALNHLTRDHDALMYPCDLYDLVGGLQAMAFRLPQLFGQLAGWLTAEAEAGRVAHDSGEAPRTWIDDVLAALAHASDSADELANDLRKAHEAAAGLKAAPG